MNSRDELEVEAIMARIADRRNQPNPPGTLESIEAELATAPKSIRAAIAAGDEALAEEVYSDKEIYGEQHNIW